jgi:hypothetical protein
MFYVTKEDTRIKGHGPILTKTLSVLITLKGSSNFFLGNGLFLISRMIQDLKMIVTSIVSSMIKVVLKAMATSKVKVLSLVFIIKI